jgi:hypothetical protein
MYDILAANTLAATGFSGATTPTCPQEHSRQLQIFVLSSLARY